jgi:hypothetical protein
VSLLLALLPGWQFLHAAGIACSRRLGDIIAALPPGDEAEAVALLGLGQPLAPRLPSPAVPVADRLNVVAPWCAWLGRQLLRGGY